jgi:FkbM family methyltransferase
MRSLIKTVIDYKALAFLKRISVEILSRLNIVVWSGLHTGQLLKVDLSSSVGRSIYLRGAYEPEVEKCMRNILRTGNVFIDIGANVGYFSIICAGLVGPVGQVHSFDPHKKVIQLLVESAKRNQYNNIYVNQVALSSREETLNFVYLRNSAFSWTLPIYAMEKSPYLSQVCEELVSAIPLDQYVQSMANQDIALIKIDVEGAEYKVLMGARETLLKHSPSILIEAQDWSLSRYGHTIDDIFNFLNPLHYRAFDLTGMPIKDAEDARRRLEDFRVQNLLFKKQRMGD